MDFWSDLGGLFDSPLAASARYRTTVANKATEKYRNLTLISSHSFNRFILSFSEG